MKFPHLISALSAVALSGCAGPATPLGAVWSFTPVSGVVDFEGGVAAADRAPAGEGGAKLTFDPPRQNLHARGTLKILVDDPAGIPEDYDFWIRYQGVDVTDTFLSRAKVSTQDRALRIELTGLTLSPSEDHQIEAGYRSPAGALARARLPAPWCKAFTPRPIRSTAGFDPPGSLMREIDQASRQAGFSPAFTAALVAQESAFEPNRVSWARAVGLTQVTPSAEAEIVPLFEQWPRYPGLASLPAPLIQALVSTGRANARNEWRLEPGLSLRGGLTYARKLSDRWQRSAEFGRSNASAGALARWPGDPEVERTQLILASYHSGFARVQAAVNRLGPRWLSSPDLKGAHLYVNRIMSYCDSFQSSRNL